MAIVNFARLLFIALASWCFFVTASTDDLLSSLNNVNSAVGDLASALSIQRVSFFGALSIDSNARLVGQKISLAIQSAQGVQAPLTVSTTNKVISSLKPTNDNVQAIVASLIRLFPQIQALGLLGVAQTDITNLRQSVADFAAALVALAPSTHMDKANSMAGSFNDALTKAANAYGIN